MGLTILVPRPETARRRFQAAASGGRRVGAVVGSYVSDLAALRKTIMLCALCVHRFNPRRYQYEPWRRDLYAVAACDDCRATTHGTRIFIHESLHQDVGDPELAARRRGRWARLGR